MSTHFELSLFFTFNVIKHKDISTTNLSKHWVTMAFLFHSLETERQREKTQRKCEHYNECNNDKNIPWSIKNNNHANKKSFLYYSFSYWNWRNISFLRYCVPFFVYYPFLCFHPETLPTYCFVTLEIEILCTIFRLILLWLV